MKVCDKTCIFCFFPIINKYLCMAKRSLLSERPSYNTKILIGDFNAKVGREDIFKPTIGNESAHHESNDNCVRTVNFATSKNLVPAPKHS